VKKDCLEPQLRASPEVPRDAFGHIKLDAVNVGQYFAETFSKLIGAGLSGLATAPSRPTARAAATLRCKPAS